jgi:hypothetical protein
MIISTDAKKKEQKDKRSICQTPHIFVIKTVEYEERKGTSSS